MSEIRIVIKIKQNQDLKISLDPSVLIFELVMFVKEELNCTDSQEIKLFKDEQELNPDMSLNDYDIINNQTLLAIMKDVDQMKVKVQNQYQICYFKTPSFLGSDEFSYNIDSHQKAQIIYDLVKKKFQSQLQIQEFESQIYYSGVLLHSNLSLSQQNIPDSTIFTINPKIFNFYHQYCFIIPQLGNTMITLQLNPYEKAEIAYDKIREEYNYLNQEWDIQIYHHGVLLLPHKSFVEQRITDGSNFKFFINVISTGGLQLFCQDNEISVYK